MLAGGTMKDFDPRPQLKSVRVPTLITAGRYDPVCPPVVAYQIQAAFPKDIAKYVGFVKSSWLAKSPTMVAQGSSKSVP